MTGAAGPCGRSGKVLDDDSLSDPACFEKIEGILSVLETLGPGGGGRHDA